jgi:hypothetical protein
MIQKEKKAQQQSNPLIWIEDTKEKNREGTRLLVVVVVIVALLVLGFVGPLRAAGPCPLRGLRRRATRSAKVGFFLMFGVRLF